jgi:hypothetical protein
MVDTVETHQRRFDRERLADIYADRLEALLNLAFLMRNDIDRQEKLRQYLQCMDVILERMAKDDIAQVC